MLVKGSNPTICCPLNQACAAWQVIVISKSSQRIRNFPYPLGTCLELQQGVIRWMKKESCYPPASEMNSVALNGVDTRETTEKIKPQLDGNEPAHEGLASLVECKCNEHLLHLCLRDKMTQNDTNHFAGQVLPAEKSRAQDPLECECQIDQQGTRSSRCWHQPG
jgi:hypothetical protein